MADALIAPAVGGAMYVCSAAAAGYSIKKVREENDPKKIPVMGIMGAFVFATQMMNFTIPGTGSSGHLCGGMLLSALLPDYAFKGSESVLGTSFSGILGGLLVVALCIGACYAFKLFKKKKS